MKTKIVIFLVILVTIALRVYDIEQKNLWFDEVYSWKIAQGNIVQIVSETSGDIHPPFYYIVLKFWMQIFSDSVFSMRMLSVLLSLLSIYFILKLSRMFLKQDMQIIFVLLLYAVSPLNIYYSQEVRMLNLNLFLCLGSVYFFFEVINTATVKAGLLYSVFTILALYTHYFALLILFTELILIIIFYYFQNNGKKTLKRYLLYFLLVNILYIPWYPVFLLQVSKGQPWRKGQTIMEIGNSILDYFKDIFLSIYFNFESNAVFYFSIFFSIILVTFLIFSLLKIINSGTFFTDRQNSIILLFCIPFLIAVIISLRQSIVLSRYLSILLPYLFIMLVYFSFKLYQSRTAIVITIFVLMTSIYGTYLNYNNNFKNNDYRKVISYIENNFNPGDGIIVEPHFMGWSINYHLKHSNSNLKEPDILGWDLNMQLNSLKEKTDLNKLWFVLDYSALGQNNYDSLPALMSELGYKRAKEKSFYIIPAKVNVEYYVKSF